MNPDSEKKDKQISQLREEIKKKITEKDFENIEKFVNSENLLSFIKYILGLMKISYIKMSGARDEKSFYLLQGQIGAYNNLIEDFRQLSLIRNDFTSFNNKLNEVISREMYSIG